MPFADKLDICLPYASNNVLTTTAATGVVVGHQYRINSMYDPDLTSVGHQPYQWDQVSPMYTYYRVHRFDYEVVCNANGDTGVYAGINLTFVVANSAIGQTFNILNERTESKLKLLSNTGAQQVVFKGTIYPEKIMGYTKVQYNGDTQTEAAVNNNPAFAPLLEIITVDPLARGSAVSVPYTVKFKYHCQLYGYIAPALS